MFWLLALSFLNHLRRGILTRQLRAVAGGAPSFAGETGESPTVYTFRVRHAAEASASTDFEETIGAAPFAGNITAVRFIPDAAMTGATATATTLSVNNKTQTLVPATFAFITGQNLVAWAIKTLTVGNAANVAVAQNDVLSFAKTHASTGTQAPAGAIEIDLTRADTL